MMNIIALSTINKTCNDKLQGHICLSFQNLKHVEANFGLLCSSNARVFLLFIDAEKTIKEITFNLI